MVSGVYSEMRIWVGMNNSEPIISLCGRHQWFTCLLICIQTPSFKDHVQHTTPNSYFIFYPSPSLAFFNQAGQTGISQPCPTLSCLHCLGENFNLPAINTLFFHIPIPGISSHRKPSQFSPGDPICQSFDSL